MSTQILNSPVLLTLVNGYTPFTPDAGIFCGGYQGPLYPNPTTFIIPDFKFDVVPFQNPVATAYIMKNTGDVYDSGFGIGNPGIKYRNPGHILGILDTFCRMSYGLGIIQAARQGIESFDINPIIDIVLPFKKINSVGPGGVVDITRGFSDLYPAYSEIPSDYLKQFVVDQILVLDPRTDEPYIFGGTKCIPNTNKIDLELLFDKILLRSYVGLPEIFRTFFTDLNSSISDFNNQKIVQLSFDGPWGKEGTLIADLPNPLEDLPEWLIDSRANNIEVFADDAGYLDGDGIPHKYNYINQCTTIAVPQAKKILTGNEDFHQNSETVYEYRSLTELNSVINLLPIQTHALQYYYTTDYQDGSLPPTFDRPGGIVFVSYLICDICFTTFQKDEISISVTSEINNLDRSLIFNYFATDILTFNSERQFLFASSVTNKFAWDRKWFGIEDNEQTETFEDGVFTTKYYDNFALGWTQDFIESSPFSANRTLVVGDGAHTIRGRIILKSKCAMDATFGIHSPFFTFNFEQLKLDLNITIGSLTSTHSFALPIDTTPIIPGA